MVGKVKRYFFDTWYGAFVIWFAFSVILLAFTVASSFVIISKWVGIPIVVLNLLSCILCFVAWIVSLVKRRWKRSLVQALVGVFWSFAFVCLFIFQFFIVKRGESEPEDEFADEWTVPQELEESIAVPTNNAGRSSAESPKNWDDEFGQHVASCLASDGNDDPTVSYDLCGLAELVHCRHDELMAYLARHPGWWLHEDRGVLCATRRLRVGGIWVHELHACYSGQTQEYREWQAFRQSLAVSDEGKRHDGDPEALQSQDVTPYGDYPEYQKATYFQMRTTIDFPMSPLGKQAEHPSFGTVIAKLEKGNLGCYFSTERFGDERFCVAITEETASRERRITKAVLGFLEKEFSSLELPPDAIKRGPEEFTLTDGMQPGIYNLQLRINPGEPGVTYLRVFEVTTETSLSEYSIKERSGERVGWSDDPDEKFLYEDEFKIYEGDWGKPYAARIEVWFRPDSGSEERKLMERTCKIEGWQR